MIDLTCSAGVDRFLDLFGTRRGRWLANRLGLSGAGSERFAGSLSNLAWNRRAFYACQTENARNIYAHAISLIREEIARSPQYNPARHRI